MEGLAPERRVGTTLRGKYRLDRLLGVGGMAAVYAGSHRNGLTVAIKVLHPWAAADAAIVERFVREGYIANAIEHPGAVRVLDDDVTEDGAVFLVMELLRGRSLSDVAPSGPAFPLDAALDAADQLLDVLAIAHAKRIVHRDIKPDNVFVTDTGLLKLLDLGIARMRGITGNSVATRSGALMGTPGFMPPEQVLGQQEQIDARSDVWAVGATLFALLTGSVVHEAATPEQTMLRAATTPVPPLASVAAHVPAPIAAVIDRALAMAQEHRWQDARAMQLALRETRAALGVPAFASGEPLARALHGADALSRTVAAAPLTTTSRMAVAAGISSDRPARRSRARMAVVAGIVLAASAAATFMVAPRLLGAHAPPARAQASEPAAPAAPPVIVPAETTAIIAPAVAEAPPVASPAPVAPSASAKASSKKKTSSPARAKTTTPAPPAPAPGPAPDPFDRP